MCIGKWAKNITSHKEANGKAAAVAHKHLRDDSNSLVEEMHTLNMFLVVANAIFIVIQRPSIGHKFEFILFWSLMMKVPQLQLLQVSLQMLLYHIQSSWKLLL